MIWQCWACIPIGQKSAGAEVAAAISGGVCKPDSATARCTPCCPPNTRQYQLLFIKHRGFFPVISQKYVYTLVFTKREREEKKQNKTKPEDLGGHVGKKQVFCGSENVLIFLYSFTFPAWPL